jgi:hypothetical protein
MLHFLLAQSNQAVIHSSSSASLRIIHWPRGNIDFRRCADSAGRDASGVTKLQHSLHGSVAFRS